MRVTISNRNPIFWYNQLTNLGSGVNKIAKIEKEIFKSPTIWLTLCSFAALASIVCLLTITTPLALLIPAFFAILSVSIYFRFKKEILYETFLWPRLLESSFFPLKKYKWFHKISDNLYLGGIPLKNKNHLEKFQKKGITTVLSLLEDFEYRNTPISFPITKKDFKNANFIQWQIVTKDFQPVDLKDIIYGVNFIKKETKKGNKVYVHCKSGVGRSATIVSAYIMEKYNLTPENAVEFVKIRRPIIKIRANLKNCQFLQIQKYYEYLQRKRSFF